MLNESGDVALGTRNKGKHHILKYTAQSGQQVCVHV